MNTKTDLSNVAQSQQLNLWLYVHSYQTIGISLAVLNAVSKCVVECVSYLPYNYFYIFQLKVFKAIYWFM